MQSGRKAQKPGGRREANSAVETREGPAHTDGKASNCSLIGHFARTEAVISPSTLDFEVRQH